MGIGVKYRIIGSEHVGATKQVSRRHWSAVRDRGKNREPYQRIVMTVRDTNKRYPLAAVVKLRKRNGVGRQPNRLQGPRIAGYVL